MVKYLLLFSLIFLGYHISFSQGQMVLNNNAYLVIDNGAYVVLENPATNALSTAGSGGYVISEDETNRVRWRIGNNTGAYTIPFARGNTKIPLTMNISSGGSGGNYIDFSTYGRANWNNESYMPSMVTHMVQLLAPNVPNHSDKAIDRFWIMNPVNHSTMPTAAITFTYIDDEHTQTGNNIDEAKLAAQRFNTGAGTWGDMWPVGTANTGANTVVTPPIAASDFFAAWTLSQIDDPLPVELIAFNAECNDIYADVRWATATETNASHFVVERSIDGFNWEEVCYTEAQGNSVTETHYSCSAEMQRGYINYFRLVQVDFDGEQMIYGPISAACESTNADFSVYPNPANNMFIVEVNLPEDEKTTINLLDMTGKIITQKHVMLHAGVNQVVFDSRNYAMGSYTVQVISSSKFAPKKLMIHR